MSCFGSSVPVIDPPGSCGIPMLGFPPSFVSSIRIRIDDSEREQTEDCALAPGAWTWDEANERIELCAQTCMEFEAAALVDLTWAIPCE